jgi:hypothetical protein
MGYRAGSTRLGYFVTEAKIVHTTLIAKAFRPQKKTPPMHQEGAFFLF